MSLNIPKCVVDVAQKITITLDVSCLGPRQIKSYERMARSGICKGNSIPALMAKGARQMHGIPWMHKGNYRSLSWGNLRCDDLRVFDKLQAAVGAFVLEQEGRGSAWMDKLIVEAQRLISERAGNGQSWIIGAKFMECIGPKFALDPLESIPSTITYDPR